MLPHYYLNRVLDSLTMLQKALFIGKIGFIALQILAEIDALGDDYIVAPLNPLRDMMMAVIDFTEKFEESEGVRHMASPGPDPEQEEAPAKTPVPMTVPASIPNKRHEVQNTNTIRYRYHFEVYGNFPNISFGLLQTVNDVGPGKSFNLV